MDKVTLTTQAAARRVLPLKLGGEPETICAIAPMHASSVAREVDVSIKLIGGLKLKYLTHRVAEERSLDPSHPFYRMVETHR